MIKKSNNSFNYFDEKIVTEKSHINSQKKIYRLHSKSFYLLKKKNLYKNKMKLIQIVKTSELGV